MLSHWQAPGGSEELAVSFGAALPLRVLVLPAWFDESNKLRHFTVEAMRELASVGIASVLPDLPGCNESTAPLSGEDLQSWRLCADAAAKHFGCTHVLAIRAGANIAPDLPGWAYAPLAAKSALRGLLRARIIASKEAGRAENRDDLLAAGMAEGLDLAGYRIGANMVSQMSETGLENAPTLTPIAQPDLGGAGLWLRAEPEHDPAQANTLAKIIAADIGG